MSRREGIVWWRLVALSLIALVAALLGTARNGRAETNLLHNGDFSVGSEDSVDGWRTDAWIQSPDTTDYHWIRPANGTSGEIELLTHHDNDARWLQPVSLGPGWYRISAEVKTVKVLTFFTGANVSILEDGITSADLRGDHNWTPLRLFLKIGPRGADIDVCMRLGGYANLTRGQAFFRNARIERVSAPAPGTPYVFDLDAIRKQEVTGPIGRPWTLAATLMLLAALAVLGWSLLSEPPRRIAKAPTTPINKSKAGGR
ncbi:MAG TPA: hypothetical protein VKS22_01815 [Candidatus Binataceae bacterium]|nr:hypothetical protein [Candidatus Binataceae bacterium]